MVLAAHFEFIITLVIAELICVPMSDVSIPLLYGIVSVLAVFILHQIFTMLERSGRFMRKAISGSPSIIINKDGVDIKELRKNNVGMDDLMESLRGCGVFSLDTVLYAVFESNGKLSVLKDENAECEELSVLIISDGKMIKENLDRVNVSEREILNVLAEKNAEINDVALMTADRTGKIYFQKTRGKKDVFNLSRGQSI